jgi:hypothetical protein
LEDTFEIIPPLEKVLVEIEQKYICDIEGRGIEYWHQQVADRMPYLAFRRWTIEQKWQEKRQRVLKSATARFLRNRHIQLLNSRSRELDADTQTREFLVRQLKPIVDDEGRESFPYAVVDYYRIIRALKVMDGLVEKKRSLVEKTIQPLLAVTEDVQQEGARAMPFSRTEMRSLAHDLLERRLAARRGEKHGDGQGDEERRSADAGTAEADE